MLRAFFPLSAKCWLGSGRRAATALTGIDCGPNLYCIRAAEVWSVWRAQFSRWGELSQGFSRIPLRWPVLWVAASTLMKIRMIEPVGDLARRLPPGYVRQRKQEKWSAQIFCRMSCGARTRAQHETDRRKTGNASRDRRARFEGKAMSPLSGFAVEANQLV